ncbi:response regulator transcription factor [Oligoflexia bacterium]|nr:response regulator transcription factor [Oligoflexia bacterium]
MKTRILLAEDHEIFVQSLWALLEKQVDVEVVGKARNGKEAVQLAKTLKPSIVVMDVVMPDMTGIEATRRIMELENSPKVIALSAHADKRFVAEMLKAGASGYLLKRCAVEDLIEAIAIVQRGETFLSPDIMGVVVNDYVQQLSPKRRSGLSKLTSRELDVLKLFVEGGSAKEIAAQLNLSVQTISGHRSQIMSKLGLKSIAELTKYAIREGLTGIDS